MGAFRLDVEMGVAHFAWDYACPALPDARHDCEMSMAAVMRLKRLTATEWRPKEVWFQHSKPHDTSEHNRIFRAPARFGMRKNVLVFGSQVLDLPLRTADTTLHRKTTNAIEQLLRESHAEANFSQAVLSFLRQNLSGGDFDVDTAACAFGMSRRSFQRKLEKESTSYRGLLEQARLDLSEYLLRDTATSATATAYALGYSEPSVFHRAFQKWRGEAPGRYRRSLRKTYE